MAKRYHQSKRARMHEERGMEHHLRGPVKHHNDREEEKASYRRMGGAEHYAGAEPRRRQEMSDMGMIHEDHREVANLPQQVVMRPYGGGSSYLPEDLDDTIRGIQRQMDYDDGKRMQHFYPKKV